MAIEKKVRLVQAFAGAVILTLLMIPMGLVGFGQYTWMLFLPLLLFFALGAQFKNVPSMLVGYGCGILWAFVPGFIGGFLAATGAPKALLDILPPVVSIFLILTIHENLLRKTILGNIPSLFLGMASTFFVFSLQPGITPFHLALFFIYGMFLAVVMVASGGMICALVFGKETVQNVFSES